MKEQGRILGSLNQNQSVQETRHIVSPTSVQCWCVFHTIDQLWTICLVPSVHVPYSPADFTSNPTTLPHLVHDERLPGILQHGVQGLLIQGVAAAVIRVLSSLALLPPHVQRHILQSAIAATLAEQLVVKYGEGNCHSWCQVEREGCLVHPTEVVIALGNDMKSGNDGEKDQRAAFPGVVAQVHETALVQWPDETRLGMKQQT